MDTHPQSVTGDTLMVVLVGDSGVGKTSLIHSLSGQDFRPTEATHGISPTALDSDREVLITEIAGETPRENVLVKLNDLRPAVVLVLVDPLNERLERDITRWGDLLTSNTDEPYQRLLVAARCDRGPHDTETLRNLATRHSFDGVFDTSAKDATGIQELRTSVLNAVSTRDEEDDGNLGDVSLVVRTMVDSLCELVARDANILQQIEWRDLERLVAATLEKIGFTVILTPPAKDGGKDVIANCIVGNKEKTFYVEIKHWCKGDRPGAKQVSEFIELNAREGTDGGLFLSSSGFTAPVHSRLAEIRRQHVRLGQREKLVSLCQQYVKRKKGLWVPHRPLPDLLFEHTLN